METVTPMKTQGMQSQAQPVQGASGFGQEPKKNKSWMMWLIIALVVLIAGIAAYFLFF